MSGTSGAAKSGAQPLPPRFELKLALAGAAVASTLGGWAGLARSAPAPKAPPVQAVVEAPPVTVPQTVVQQAPVQQVPVQQAPLQPPPAQPAAVQPQPAAVQPAPRVVVVPTPRPATGAVAATSRSSR